MTATWQFRFAPSPKLPALAWLARIPPALGTLVFRWAVSVVRPRYRAVERSRQ